MKLLSALRRPTPRPKSGAQFSRVLRQGSPAPHPTPRASFDARVPAFVSHFGARTSDLHGRSSPGLLVASGLLAAFLWVCALTAHAAPAVRIPLVESPLPGADVRDLGGYVGQRIQTNREVYLKTFDIDHYTAMVEQKRQRDWWWIGEQPGKWLESAVLASRTSGDAPLEAKARQILARLAAAQEPGGYLGITDPAVRTDAQPLRGMDPYELYFMLHGLLTAAEEWNDPQALTTARRLGDYFVAHIGPGKAEFWPSPYRPPENRHKILCPQSTWLPPGAEKAPQLYTHSEIAGHTAHYGWEGSLLIDPMLRLYQATTNASYLEWSQWVVANLDRWSGWDAFSNLDRVADGELGVDQLQPYVHAHTFQMNFLGFLRLYRITGDATLLRKVQGAWDDIARRQLYITGGVSVGEHYEPGYHRPVTGNVVETCATMSWMQLTQDLLELTGDLKYADAIERLLLNHVFASQTIDGDCFRYHTPPNGFKPEAYFHGPDCCTGSGHRLVSMLPRFFYARAKGAVFVNQFVPSVAQFKLEKGTALKLKVETRYPEEDTILLRLELTKPAAFTLNLRLPGWCEQPSVVVNGEPFTSAERGTYARLERTWQTGDSVSLRFPMTARWVKHDHFAGPTAPFAVVRGPLVYALDNVWWNDSAVAAPYNVGQETGVFPQQPPRPTRTPAGALGPAYEIPVKLVSGRTAKARLLPFTNVGRWYRDGQPKPPRNSRTFSYAVWLEDAEGPGFTKLAEPWNQLRDWTKNSLDFVIIGDGRSEAAHDLRQRNSSEGKLGEHPWRHAVDGGFFSYLLKVLPEQPCVLVLTYWGGDKGHRVFDVLVNDRKLATERLAEGKPDQFFEVRYPIPFDLVRGKTDALGRKLEQVMVKFQAEPGNTAGGVFGVRVEPAR